MTSQAKAIWAPRGALDPAGLAAWQDLARDLRAARRRAATAEGYRVTLEQLRGRYPGTPLLAMTRHQITGHLAALSEDHHQAAASVATHYRYARRFYRWCLAEELIDEDPTARIPAPKLPRTLTPVLSDGQLHAIIAACAGKDYAALRDTAMIRLMCEAGTPRAAELVSISTADLDMRGDAVLIHGKGGRDRLVPFGAVTGRALSKYLRARAARPTADTVPQVFTGVKLRAGRLRPLTPGGLRQIVAGRGEQAGVPGVHPHQFRHTSYHRFDQAGGGTDAAVKLYGWAGPAMTQVYGASAAARRATEHARALAIGDTL